MEIHFSLLIFYSSALTFVFFCFSFLKFNISFYSMHWQIITCIPLNFSPILTSTESINDYLKEIIYILIIFGDFSRGTQTFYSMDYIELKKLFFLFLFFSACEGRKREAVIHFQTTNQGSLGSLRF